MTMTLQEISDRMEIQELLVRYSHCIDTRNFEGLRQVFTADAHIDYTVFGGPKGSLEEIIAFLNKTMKIFKGFQHMIGNTILDIDGADAHRTASARTICHNPMVLEREGEEQVFYCGLWYVDELVRTGEGWRIRRRAEERCYVHNAPPGFA